MVVCHLPLCRFLHLSIRRISQRYHRLRLFWTAHMAQFQTLAYLYAKRYFIDFIDSVTAKKRDILLSFHPVRYFHGWHSNYCYVYVRFFFPHCRVLKKATDLSTYTFKRKSAIRDDRVPSGLHVPCICIFLYLSLLPELNRKCKSIYFNAHGG